MPVWQESAARSVGGARVANRQIATECTNIV
jgi:hypothetical protein